MPRKLSLNALILAGGQSSRMGQDKALLLVNGIPFIQQIYHIAEQCCESVYLISPWPERYYSILGNNSKIHFLAESTTGEGSLVAFLQGLKQIEKQTDWLLLLACDLPLLNPEILLNWCENLQDISPDILACVPKNNNFWEPLCGFYRPEIIPNLEDFINCGGRSFQTFLETVSTCAIALGNREQKMLLNCNTPDDLQRIN